jgi:hypothetical protein
MPRFAAVRILSPFALAAVLAACGDAPTGADDSRLRAPERPALAAAPAEPSAPPVSTVTELGDGTYRFTSTAVLEVPIGAAWAILHNIEKTVAIALPGVAQDFRWLDGGSPGKVPSRFQFQALGTTVVEEVHFVDHATHVLKYRMVVPVLGFLSYAGTIDLDPIDETRTRITFSRDAAFADPASSVEAFAALFHQEATTIQAYFNGRGT